MMRYKREKTNHTGSGSGKVTVFRAEKRDYVLGVEFRQGNSGTGYAEFAVDVGGGTLNLNGDYIEITDGRPISVRAIGETDHRTPARLNLVERIFGLSL